MPDEDKTFSGSFVLDFRIWWRQAHTLYIRHITQSPRPSYWVVYDDYDTLTCDDSSYLLLGSESQKPSNAFCIVSRLSAVVLTAHLQWILGQQKRHLCCSLSCAQNQTHETRYKTEFGNILPARVVKGINDKFSVITRLILPIIKKVRQGRWTTILKQQQQQQQNKTNDQKVFYLNWVPSNTLTAIMPNFSITGVKSSNSAIFFINST